MFGDKTARKELARYRARGPRQTTKILLDMIRSQGVRDARLLDIGGGVGAVHQQLLLSGAARAIDVDASPAFLRAAQEEAERRRLTDRVTFMEGDFVSLAGEVPVADVVTLDRVLCCYDDVEALVSLSAGRASRLYGIVLPRDTWWVRLASALGNLDLGIMGTCFRTFVHSARRIRDIIASEGLRLVAERARGLWTVELYSRTPGAAGKAAPRAARGASAPTGPV